MELAKVILENNIETEVKGLFYIYNSNYYFLYTEKELDENGYVILKLVQVGKEVKNTEGGQVETGYMIGVEPSDWDNAKKSITIIVEDKKNKTQNPEIRYLPMSMLAPLKLSKYKTIKLVKNVVEQYFNVEFENQVAQEVEPVDVNAMLGTSTPAFSVDGGSAANVVETAPRMEDANVIESTVESTESTVMNEAQGTESGFEENNDIIVDYRKSFFDEQEKNKELEAKVAELTEKLSRIKEIIE